MLYPYLITVKISNSRVEIVVLENLLKISKKNHKVIKNFKVLLNRCLGNTPMSGVGLILIDANPPFHLFIVTFQKIFEL